MESKVSTSLMQWYTCFLPGWSGAEMKSTVHDALPKLSINLSKNSLAKQQTLGTYCPIPTYTMRGGTTLCKRNSDVFRIRAHENSMR